MEQCLTIFIVFFKISLKVLNQMFERKKKTEFCLQCLYIWKLRESKFQVLTYSQLKFLEDQFLFLWMLRFPLKINIMNGYILERVHRMKVQNKLCTSKIVKILFLLDLNHFGSQALYYNILAKNVSSIIKKKSNLNNIILE